MSMNGDALTRVAERAGARYGLLLEALLDRLAGDYDLADATASALAARLDELVAAGLVATS